MLVSSGSADRSRARDAARIGTAKDALPLLVIVSVAAMINGKNHSRKSSCADDERRGEIRRWTRHPLITWLLENISIVGVVTLIYSMLPTPKHRSPASSFCMFMPMQIAMTWSLVGVQLFLTHHVYHDVPWFGSQASRRRAMSSFTCMIRDYLWCNLPNDLLNSAVFAQQATTWDRRQYWHIFKNRHFSPLSFLKKLMVVRIGTDIAFWCGHRALHAPQLYWLHRRHHEHHHPTTATNFHFSAADLFIEGGIPIGTGMGLLELFGWQPTHYEAMLLSGYMVWQLSGSHTGKALPTVTYFPPLAPLYQLMLGPVDERLIEHHEVHHNSLSCNYGITVWPDMLFGTRRETAMTEGKVPSSIIAMPA